MYHAKGRRNAYRIVGKPEGKRPTGRPRRRCGDNIKVYLKGAWKEGVDWINLAKDRGRRRAVVNVVMYFLLIYWLAEKLLLLKKEYASLLLFVLYTVGQLRALGKPSSVQWSMNQKSLGPLIQGRVKTGCGKQPANINVKKKEGRRRRS